jgi:hypothetical protein
MPRCPIPASSNAPNSAVEGILEAPVEDAIAGLSAMSGSRVRKPLADASRSILEVPIPATSADRDAMPSFASSNARLAGCGAIG